MNDAVVDRQRVAPVTRCRRRRAETAVERRRVVAVVRRRGAVGDDEAEPVHVDLRVGQRRLPEVARLGGERCLVARDAARDPRHADQLLRRVLRAVVAQRDARHVVVERAEAKRRRRARRHGALRRAIERVARVEAQPVPLDVAVGAVAGLDRQHVRPRVEREDDALVRRGDGERDVRAAGRAAGAVVDVPAAVDRRLRLVRAGRDRARLERVDAVAVRILEPASSGSRAASRRSSRARTGSCPARSRSAR